MTIAISMGDPAGIGPQIAIEAWKYFAQSGNSKIDFAIIGDAAPFEMAAANMGLGEITERVSSIKSSSEIFSSKLPIIAKCALKAPVLVGAPDPKNGAAIIEAIEAATKLVISNEADALVTLPIAKSVLYECGFSFAGHTEFVAELCKSVAFKEPRGPVMMLAIDGLKAALITIHEPLAKVPELLSLDLVTQVIRVTHSALKYDFGIASPKIALLGLNPHAGESGSMGDEEIKILNPAAKILRGEGIDCSDAIPADSAFNPENRAKYDCFVATYHDQGLIPIKTLDYWGGVNISLGLPIIRTSPDHGTGFDIASKYEANPQSLINAIKTAHFLAEGRKVANG